jgi:hypothetical protein
MATSRRCQGKRTEQFLEGQESKAVEGERRGYEIPKKDLIF